MQQAVRISDNTAFFLLGELVECGNTEPLFSQPKEKKTEDWPIIDIQSVLWSEYADLVQNQSFLPTYHLHAFTLNGGCVLFCFQCIFIIPHQLILVDGEIFLFWRVVKRGAISTFITRGAFEVFYDLPTADSQPVTTALYLENRIRFQDITVFEPLWASERRSVNLRCDDSTGK